jgi:drug/metabolite transporter (DMT)-like permease
MGQMFCEDGEDEKRKPSRIRQLWRDHSYSIVGTVLGVACFAYAIWLIWPVSPERWFDVFSELGGTLLGLGLMGVFATWLRERNKPED